MARLSRPNKPLANIWHGSGGGKSRDGCGWPDLPRGIDVRFDIDEQNALCRSAMRSQVVQQLSVVGIEGKSEHDYSLRCAEEASGQLPLFRELRRRRLSRNGRKDECVSRQTTSPICVMSARIP